MVVVVIFILIKETQSRHPKTINQFIIHEKHRKLMGEGVCSDKGQMDAEKEVL